MKNRISELKELTKNPNIENTMVWDGKQGTTYEDFWRNFLNQPIGEEKKRVISLQQPSELGGGVTTPEIGVSPPMRVANILEAESDSGALEYTGSRGPDNVMRMLSCMLNAKVGDEDFGPTDIMRTLGGTEAIALLAEYFGGKQIVQCGLGYFMQYGKGNNIKTLFNNEIGSKDDGDFKILPSIQQIENNLEKDGVIWIIQPGISGECYTEEEGKEMLLLAKEKECFVVIDTAFEGTEIDRENTANFYKLSKEEGILEETIFFGSPSKGQGFPGKRQGFLATKNEGVINELIKKAGENRDGLALNIETNAMYTFLEIFDTEKINNPDISISKSIDNVFNNFDPSERIFNSIRGKITPELIKQYLEWKSNFFAIMKNSLNTFRKNTGEGGTFSGMGGEIKSFFNIFLKIPNDISAKLIQKYDVNEIVRYMFLYNGTVVAPGQNFGGDKEFWSDKPLIFRGTLTQNPSIAIANVKGSIDFLLNNKI
ncbi:MAG: aminotransferase class I/II-fold pyridoxal phosphate-dependent enzyme [Candidatus Gracilibacteria bacterium]